MPTSVRSFAKINLGLRIGPPRADGFHSLATVYQTIGMHDLLTVQAERSAATEITLTSNHPRVPTDDRNTAVRAVRVLLEALGVTARVSIQLEKNLPMQGGLGAGSANAAAAMLALERELELDLDQDLGAGECFRLAEQIGSDVPLFLVGGASFGFDRGQLVAPLPDLPEMPCLVALPNVGCSTPEAFRAWDEHVSRLTPGEAEDRLRGLSRVLSSACVAGGNSRAGASGVSRAIRAGSDVLPQRSGDLAGNPLPWLVRTGFENDFEQVVFTLQPQLRAIRHALKGNVEAPGEGDALWASLSGSGSSLFGLYRTTEHLHAAQQRVAALGVRTVATTTLPRPAYWQRMFEV